MMVALNGQVLGVRLLSFGRWSIREPSAQLRYRFEKADHRDKKPNPGENKEAHVKCTKNEGTGS